MLTNCDRGLSRGIVTTYKQTTTADVTPEMNIMLTNPMSNKIIWKVLEQSIFDWLELQNPFISDTCNRTKMVLIHKSWLIYQWKSEIWFDEYFWWFCYSLDSHLVVFCVLIKDNFTASHYCQDFFEHFGHCVIQGILLSGDGAF